VDSYRTEEEQVEALRRWWDENGRATLLGIAIALGAGFGWQGWQASQENQAAAASDAYQDMLRALTEEGDAAAAQERAERLRSEYGGSTYAQFAALHLAALAVERGDLAEAEAQLRWVLGKAAKGSDAASVAQLRLARVVAGGGDTDQALAIIAQGGGDAYQASYAVARGDMLLAAGRTDEAREAYTAAQAFVALGGQSGANLPSLQIKLQSLAPVPPRNAVPVEEVQGQPEPVDDAAPAGGGE